MKITSEQVSCGHPDKMCDLISDAILDACLQQDKSSRVAVETLMKDYNVVVAGEITTTAEFDAQDIVTKTLTTIGVDNVEKYKVTNLIGKQSPDIAMGVDTGGAGDQGIMFGYACDETPNYMPLAHAIATAALENLRKLNHPMLKPDAKSQVTIDDSTGTKKIDTFLISVQHSEEITKEELHEAVQQVMFKTAKQFKMNLDFKALVNPTGRFVIGGSIGDAGVTGRKIIADTYGGYARHGGGAFSGKDPSKVDRSAAYMARYLAIKVIKKFQAKECEIQLSYAIGVARPISVRVWTNLGKKKDQEIEKYLKRKYDMTPQGIIRFLKLKDIKYTDTTCYGHFGRKDLPWECY